MYLLKYYEHFACVFQLYDPYLPYIKLLIIPLFITLVPHDGGVSQISVDIFSLHFVRFVISLSEA